MYTIEEGGPGYSITTSGSNYFIGVSQSLFSSTADVSGGITTINSQEPDSNGNMVLSVAGFDASNGTGVITFEHDGTYAIQSQVANATGSLQSQIDGIDGSITIESSGGTITVSDSDGVYNLEVASAPIQNHNDLEGLQGGSTGQRYHLTAAQHSGYIARSEVENVSGQLAADVSTAQETADEAYLGAVTLAQIVVDLYATKVEVAEVSAGLNARLGLVESDYSTAAETDAASANALVHANFYTDSQIAAISAGGATELVGGTGIQVVESPADTFTVSVTADYALSSEVDAASANALVHALSADFSGDYTDLTNKPTLVTPTEVSLSVGPSGSIFTDCSLGNVFTVTVSSGDIIFENPTNGVNASSYQWVVTQAVSGGQDVSFGNDFKFANGYTPVLSDQLGAVDILTATRANEYFYLTYLNNFSG